MLTDNMLMLSVKSGDVEKMGTLYNRYHKLLFRFVFNMTREKETSEDMVHNVFMRMLKYPDGFTGGEFKIWMYHIARNIVYDYLKQKNRKPFHSDIEEYAEKLESGQSSDSILEKKEDIENLTKAMNKLSDENRELLVLCRYQELKYQEIAALMNISETAVKVRVHRAMNQLKTNFLQL